MATDTVSEEVELDRLSNSIDEHDEVADDDPRFRDPLAWPDATTNPVRIRWQYAISIGLIHLLACLAFVPWLFSWTGVALCFLGLYVFGTLGINLCYHRLLTHQGFVAPKWLEHGLALLGVCTLQDTPACWVAMHRMHHKYSDTQPDPHSPLVNFLWGHCGWLMVVNRDFRNVNYYERFARDILKDRFYMQLERHSLWAIIYIGHALLFYLAGFTIGWLTAGSVMAGVQFGASLVVWGVLLRTVLTWHITWSVNSVTHLWGYQNYETRENSQNNILIGLVSNGEGWHNNHHADQRSAAHGHKWWEFDITWLTILMLEKLGIVQQVVRPKAWTKREVPKPHFQVD
ncbi:acyl-CoA desaturase [Aeoliella mucimassa]|uniref:Fatty acid desaturase n=1 Tax=Aeoliella mucimassa TaxID=2527972 RepID=A0A518AT27_9BACT|nr:fatty acid desaturase [Aeoliella mucimassa]QDU57885.1 Fatty acid desaturase [Aeoliella mucimassa]